MRPKSELNLLVEFAFRSAWGVGNTIQEYQPHLSLEESQNLQSFVVGVFASNLHRMSPEGNTRTFSEQGEMKQIWEAFNEGYNNYVMWYHQEVGTLQGLPITLSMGQSELAMREQVDKITDAICDIYQLQNT